MKHIPGIHNQVADSFLRIEVNFIQDSNLFSIDFKQFPIDQVLDRAIQELKALKLEQRRLEDTNYVPDALVTTCDRSLMSNVIARFGVSSQIICDNGPAFASQLFKDFCFNFSIKLLTKPCTTLSAM